MNSRTASRPLLPVVAVISLIILWSTASWYWYTCILKNTCTEPKVVLTVATSTRAVAQKPVPEYRAPSCPVLTKHLRRGWENDPREVALLERMLLTLNLGKVTQDGVFGADEQSAITAFQKRFASEVWTSRSIKVPGAVDKVAREKLNALYCEFLTSNKL